MWSASRPAPGRRPESPASQQNEDVAVIGPVTARLHVSSSCPDTDFTIKLIDVCPPNADYPRGFAMNLTDAQELGYILTTGDGGNHVVTITEEGDYTVSIGNMPTTPAIKTGCPPALWI